MVALTIDCVRTFLRGACVGMFYESRVSVFGSVVSRTVLTRDGVVVIQPCGCVCVTLDACVTHLSLSNQHSGWARSRGALMDLTRAKHSTPVSVGVQTFLMWCGFPYMPWIPNITSAEGLLRRSASCDPTKL